MFGSTWSVLHGEFTNLISSGYFMYLSHSKADFTSTKIGNLTLNSVGSLATMSDQSSLLFHNPTLEHITSFDHGVISLKSSQLTVTFSTIQDLNMSLIVASESSISITNSEIGDIIWGYDEGVREYMLPEGGLVNCMDCVKVEVKRCSFSRIMAYAGGGDLGER